MLSNTVYLYIFLFNYMSYDIVPILREYYPLALYFFKKFSAFSNTSTMTPFYTFFKRALKG